MLTAGPKWVARRVLLPALSVAFLLVLPATSIAATCGDDIDGRRVPCACDDIVGSDTVLQVGDPVLNGRCPFNGLRILAPPMAESITLDLNGLSIVGSGFGDGVGVLRGGSDGAVITGGSREARGEIVSFGNGVVSRRAGMLRRVSNVVVKGNTRNGLTLHTAGAIVEAVKAAKNGVNGLSINGRGGRLIDVEASENAATGISLRGSGIIVEATTSGNGRHGMICDGRRNDISAVVTEGNGRHGALVRGRTNKIVGLISRDNTRESFSMAREGRAK